MKFVASIPYRSADVGIYEELKSVVAIREQPARELSVFEGRLPDSIVRLVGSSMASAWMAYAVERLREAALNRQGPRMIPSPFPGRFLPRGGGRGPVDRGCLQVDWARHALEMEQPVETAERIERRLNGSGLQILRFSLAGRNGEWDERRLREEAQDLLWARDRSKALTWVDRLWSPGQVLPPVRREVLSIVRDFIAPFHGQVHDSLALLLEVHDVVRRLETHAALGIERVGVGVERGVWCEVGLIDLAAIKATELVQTARAVQELRTIHTRGFAPIVINEWGCNTDGSHRQVAAWLWNALCAAKGRRIGIEAAVGTFIEEHHVQMGTLLAHEIERVFREAYADEALRSIIEEAFCEAAMDRRVARLPVVFVPEWSAATVVKGLYDDSDRSIRVCPSVYGLMARDPRIVFPARGPYHRTDALPLPWFQVVPD